MLCSGAASSAQSLITGQPDPSAASKAATQRSPARNTAAAATATRTRVFLDVAPFGDDAGGRLELELYSDIVPATAQNFKQLCTGEHGLGSSGKPLHYKGAARPVRCVGEGFASKRATFATLCTVFHALPSDKLVLGTPSLQCRGVQSSANRPTCLDWFAIYTSIPSFKPHHLFALGTVVASMLTDFALAVQALSCTG